MPAQIGLATQVLRLGQMVQTDRGRAIGPAWGRLAMLLLVSLAALLAGGLVRPAWAQGGAGQDPCAWPRQGAAEALLTEALVREGFEAVAVCVGTDEARLTFENRLYRYDVRALLEVVDLADEYLAGVDRVVLLPRRLGLPMAEVTVPLSAYRAFAAGRLPSAAFADSVQARLDVRAPVARPGRANRPTFKLDLVAHPQLAMEFGNFDDPVETQLSLAPAVTTSLWTGMRLTGQLVIPLQNDIDPEDRAIRPGLLTLRQTLRLPHAVFATATVGAFTQNRYGVDLETTAYALGGRLVARGRLGRTGYLDFENGRWFYGDLDVTTYAVGIEYVLLPRYAFSVAGRFERFLYGDHGWGIDLRRRFGEVHIDFFALFAEDRPNVGATLVLPLPMARYLRPGRVRVRPADAFAFRYRYRRLSGFGATYSTTPVPEDPLGPLNPALLDAHLLRWDID